MLSLHGLIWYKQIQIFSSIPYYLKLQLVFMQLQNLKPSFQHSVLEFNQNYNLIVIALIQEHDGRSSLFYLSILEHSTKYMIIISLLYEKIKSRFKFIPMECSPTLVFLLQFLPFCFLIYHSCCYRTNIFTITLLLGGIFAFQKSRIPFMSEMA